MNLEQAIETIQKYKEDREKIMRIDPSKNAVIIELDANNDPVVYIECKDKDKLWLLQELAKDIKQSGVA